MPLSWNLGALTSWNLPSHSKACDGNAILQQNTGTPLFDLHVKSEKSYIVDSYTGVKNNKEKRTLGYHGNSC
jgi:hypothetical protein